MMKGCYLTTKFQNKNIKQFVEKDTFDTYPSVSPYQSESVKCINIIRIWLCLLL